MPLVAGGIAAPGSRRSRRDSLPSATEAETMRPARRALLSLTVAVLLAGCGNDLTPPPDIGVIGAPGGLAPAIYR